MILTPEGKDKLFAIGTISALICVMYVVTKPFITTIKRSEMIDKKIVTDIHNTYERED